MLLDGLKRALNDVARPVRRDTARAGVAIHPYRGYGTPGRVFLIGRVLRQPRFDRRRRPARGSVGDVVRRLLRRGLPGARVTACLGGARQQVETDADGYFRVDLRPLRLEPASGWHRMELVLESPPRTAGARAEGAVYVPPPEARFAVISDIDDTVVHTGVARKLEMLWNLFFRPAESRLVYPGLGPFYRALHRGAGGRECNPMLYVSRGPWSLYETLDAFFRLHGIPVGPILFLREWGLTLQSPLPRRARDHKLSLIRHMLDIYDGLPFLLIGDSGQHDPEIYARIVRENPGRVLAVYIRDAGRGPRRAREIAALAAELEAAGSSLLLAADTHAMAVHAAARGLVSPDTPETVLDPDERR